MVDSEEEGKTRTEDFSAPGQQRGGEACGTVWRCPPSSVRATDQFYSDDASSDHNHLPWNFLQGQSSCGGHDGVLVNLGGRQGSHVQDSFPLWRTKLHQVCPLCLHVSPPVYDCRLTRSDGPVDPCKAHLKGGQPRAGGGQPKPARLSGDSVMSHKLHPPRPTIGGWCPGFPPLPNAANAVVLSG